MTRMLISTALLIALQVSTCALVHADDPAAQNGVLIPRSDALGNASGMDLMREVYRRHQQYPFVYEEQSMILVDRQGNRETRKLKRYSRLDASGVANYLLVFESPAEVKGVAMLASRAEDGSTQQSFYLPAFGPVFFNNGDDSTHREDNFLGTDYSIENLIGEPLDETTQVRRENVVIDETPYYVVDILDENKEILIRRHYILQDQLFISRTDHFDDLGRLRKRQTQHDLTNVHGQMWRANMMMMENNGDKHRTIIKIDKRIFSADYVPAEVFTQEWIFRNQQPEPTESYAITRTEAGL